MLIGQVGWKYNATTGVNTTIEGLAQECYAEVSIKKQTCFDTLLDHPIGYICACTSSCGHACGCLTYMLLIFG